MQQLGTQASFHVAAGVRSSAGGRGWAGCLAPSQRRGAGLRDPALPVQPQWEAGCPPPLRGCCPSALPTRPLRPAPRGPTCEERFVLEQASHHPQQPVLHVLAASLLTLLIPRDQDNETPSGTPAPSSGLTASHVSPATHVPAMPSTGRAEPSPKPGSPPPGSPLRLALPHSDSSFLQAHTLLPTLSNMSLPAPISDREKSIKLAVTGSSAGGHLLLTPMALGPWLALCSSPGTGEQLLKPSPWPVLMELSVMAQGGMFWVFPSAGSPSPPQPP